MSLDLSTPILVVDDYQTMVRILRNLLKQIGFTDVDDASDGQAALEKLRAKKYGLVISDWNMPNCSGLDLLKRVRGDSRFARLPFVMVTAEAEKHQIVSALKVGVTNYVIKPFTAAALKEKLEA